MTLGVIAVMLSSCKKDKPSQITESPQTNYTAEDIRIQNLILNFQNKIKNNTFKNGETVSVDSAIWFLEAMMNFNYSTPDSSFVNLTVDTTFEFDLPVNNDLVDFSNLTDAAFAMESHLVEYLNSITNSIKFLIVVDVVIKPNELKSGLKTISITASYGTDYINNTACYPPFDDDDYWLWGHSWANAGGYCDGPNQGQNLDSDAAEEIEYKINNPRCYQQNDGRTIICGVTTRNIDAWDYPNPDDVVTDNYRDCLMFYNYDEYYPVDICLSPAEMDFYMFGTLEVIQSELEIVLNQNPGQTWEFICIDIVGDYFTYEGNTTYFHWADITFGRRVPYIPPID